MILSKTLIALKNLVSTDKLREHICHIHYNADEKCFEATNTNIAGRWYPKTESNENYPYQKESPELSDCILDVDAVEDLCKASKGCNNMSIIDKTIMLSDDKEKEEICNGVTNPISSLTEIQIKKIKGKYPSLTNIWPSQDKLSITTGFNAKEMLNLLKTVNVYANSVTHLFKMQYFIKSGICRIYCENSNSSEKFDGLIMRSSIDDLTKPKYIVYYEWEDSLGNTTQDYGLIWNDQADAIKEIDRKIKTVEFKTPDYKLMYYTIKEMLISDGDRKVYNYPKEEADEALTPAEENALNELTDGPGASDSAVVQQDACMAADEEPEIGITGMTIENEQKLEFLWKAGKTIEDLCEIFDKKFDFIRAALCDLDLISPEEYEAAIESEKKDTEWNEEAHQKLEFLWKAGKNIDDLSEIFSRSKDDSCGFGRYVPHAEIVQQLISMALIYDEDICINNCKECDQDCNSRQHPYKEDTIKADVKKDINNVVNKALEIPEGFVPFDTNYNKLNLKRGMRIIFKDRKDIDDKTFNKFNTDSVKLTLRSYDFFGKEAIIAGNYTPVGISINSHPYYVLPYEFIKYFAEEI